MSNIHPPGVVTYEGDFRAHQCPSTVSTFLIPWRELRRTEVFYAREGTAKQEPLICPSERIEPFFFLSKALGPIWK